VAATKLYTTAEAAEILGVASITVWRWVNAGRIRAVDLSTGDRAKLRIREDDLQKFIDDRTLEQSA
jgi:excisionase family DNA binding protein